MINLAIEPHTPTEKIIRLEGMPWGRIQKRAGRWYAIREARPGKEGKEIDVTRQIQNHDLLKARVRTELMSNETTNT